MLTATLYIRIILFPFWFWLAIVTKNGSDINKICQKHHSSDRDTQSSKHTHTQSHAQTLIYTPWKDELHFSVIFSIYGASIESEYSLLLIYWMQSILCAMWITFWIKKKLFHIIDYLFHSEERSSAVKSSKCLLLFKLLFVRKRCPVLWGVEKLMNQFM